jgi:hypothetical protein
MDNEVIKFPECSGWERGLKQQKYRHSVRNVNVDTKRTFKF